MSRARSLLKHPQIEYLDRTYEPQKNTVAFDSEIGIEEITHLISKYKEICKENRMDEYEELLSPKDLKAAANEYLEPEFLSRLMNTEFGQGIAIGYLWSCIDWASYREDNHASDY